MSAQQAKTGRQRARGRGGRGTGRGGGGGGNGGGKSRKRGTRTQPSGRGPPPLPPRPGLSFSKYYEERERFDQVKADLATMPGQMAQYCKQIMLPGECSNSVLIPSLAETELCSRVLTKEYVLNAANITAVTGESMIYVPPDLFSPAYVMSRDAALVPPVPGLPSFFSDDVRAAGGNGTATVQGTLSFENTEDKNNRFLAPIQHISVAGVWRSGYPITSTLLGQFTCVVRSTGGNSLSGWRLRIHFSNGAAWNLLQTINVPAKGGDPVNAAVTVPLDGVFMAFTMETAAGTQITDDSNRFSISAFWTQGQSQFSTASSPLNLFHSVQQSALDLKITTGRVTAMSVLCTNVGPEINRRGTIYAARATPSSILAGGAESTIAASFARLPANRSYSGDAKHGAYVWWLPDNKSLMDATSVHEYAKVAQGEEGLFIYMSGLDPLESSFRLKFKFVVDFYTPNQLFEKLLPPPSSEQWRRTLRALANSPAATCNPDHYELFRSILRKGFDTAQGVAGHYQEHKALYNSLFSLLAGLAA